MAERRMFAKMIVDSDVFLDMPQTTQNLYFHLNMRADDEGFINAPKKIMRMIGANQNDLEILLSKRYLLAFESGVVVVKHWLMHNTIRKDRMKATVYTEERKQISIKENNSYTECQPNVNQVSTISQHSIVECSVIESNIVENSIVKSKSVSKKPKKHKHGEFKNVLLTNAEHERLVKDFGETKALSLIQKLDEGIELKGYKYKNHNLAIRKWNTNEKTNIDKWKGEQNFDF